MVNLTEKLEYIENKNEKFDENAEQLMEAIKKAAKSQKDMGLGNPEGTMMMLLERFSIPTLIQNGFKEIRKPNPHYFIPFIQQDSWYSYANIAPDVNVEDFPKRVQVELTERIQQLTLKIGQENKTAQIPLIPTSVQALIKRIKEKVPSIKFHLLFIPMWERKPNPDPVLVGEADGRFFELASWGGDEAALKEFMEDIV